MGQAKGSVGQVRNGIGNESSNSNSNSMTSSRNGSSSSSSSSRNIINNIGSSRNGSNNIGSSRKLRTRIPPIATNSRNALIRNWPECVRRVKKSVGPIKTTYPGVIGRVTPRVKT